MTAKKRRMILFGVAVTAIVALSLSLLLSDTLRDLLLRPLLELWINFRYGLSFMSERVQWTAALGIGFVVLIATLFSRMPVSSETHSGKFMPPFPSRGPMLRLNRLFTRAHRSRFAQEQAVLELRSLASKVLAGSKGISVDQAKEQIEAGTWTDDQRSRRFLLADSESGHLRHNRNFIKDVEHVLSQIQRVHQEV